MTGPRLVPGTGGECVHLADGAETGRHPTGIFIEANQDPRCFSIRSVDHCEPGMAEPEQDLIHFCDWPVLREAIDQFMKDRVQP